MPTRGRGGEEETIPLRASVSPACRQEADGAAETAPWNIDGPEYPGVARDRRIRVGIDADTFGGPRAALPTDQVRNARHGYYANTSYFDDWLGRLVTTLEEIGRLDRTVIIVTADHGDMLGDRGVFFKMSFHERSARVPLVMAGPGDSACCPTLEVRVVWRLEGGKLREISREETGRLEH